MEGCEQKRISKKIPKSHNTNLSKDVRSKDNDDAHSGGGIGDDTAEVKRKSEDHIGVDTSIQLIPKYAL